MNILLIQSRISESSRMAEREGFQKIVQGVGQITPLSSLDAGHDWGDPRPLTRNFDALIIAGSGDFDFDGGRHEDDSARKISREITKRLRPLVTLALDTSFPLLGICYGHQIVGEIHDVRVIHDHVQKKIGSHQVRLTEEGKRDPLTKNLPHEFHAQYGHKDSLSCVPQHAALLACGDACDASMLRYGTHAYTMQFHPELTHDELAYKLRSAPGYLPEGIDIESLVQPSPEASRIIPLFLERIVSS